MRKSILLLTILFGINSAFSQSQIENHIEIFKDSRINHYLNIEKRNDKIDGYRIQICQDANKGVVDRSRDKFLKLYPLTDTYINFENPHFTLKVGDFRTMNDAEKIKREIFGEFVISVVQNEKVNLPRID